MDSALALLRTSGVLIVCLGLGLSLYVSHVGRAAALSAARSGAAAAERLVTDGTNEQTFDCALGERNSALAAAAESAAATAIVSRLEQTTALTATDLKVHLDEACVLLVGVTVAASTWFPLPKSSAVVCQPLRSSAATFAVAALRRC